ncbi:acyltransferase family protein [Scytonema sp. NUACC26]|uniref:acyltransferase family protein n=1 Tax=Scytonema sp. NUACC26 TaxID=3140176 RepID=UPI0034DBF463
MQENCDLKHYERISNILPAVKGLAILMIVMYHLLMYSQNVQSFSQIITFSSTKGLASLVDGLISTFCYLGKFGVHFFLIASGFGLGASWWRQTHLSSKKYFTTVSFWQRRLLRLLPLYWLAIGLALILFLINHDLIPYGKDIFTQGGVEVFTAILATLTTFRNLIWKYYFFLNGAWWYVGLAIQLYFIFPFLIGCIQRWSYSILLLGSLIVSLLYRGLVVALPLNDLATNLLLRGSLFPSRLFEFVFGLVLAIVLLEKNTLKNSDAFNSFVRLSKNLVLKPSWLGFNIFLWVLGFVCDWVSSSEQWMILRVPSDALIGVGEFGLIFHLLCSVKWANKWLSLLGNYSYGIFLTHMNIYVGLWFVMQSFIHSYWVRFALVTLITCALGMFLELSYNWVVKKCFSKQLA